MRQDNSVPVKSVGIAICGKRLAYCVFEHPSLLLDWGIIKIPTRDINKIEKPLSEIWTFYAPYRVRLEDVDSPQCRLSDANKKLVQQIRTLAHDHNVGVRAYSWAMVKGLHGLKKSDNLHQAAQHLGERFPVLATRIPPYRRPWQTEHSQMILFKAAALSAINP